MVDDLEDRLTRYRGDLDAAVSADLARRHLASREARFDDADPLLLDTDHQIRLEPTSAPHERRRVMLVATLVAAAVTTLVLVAVVVSRDATPADQPSPAVTVPPTTPPRALFGTFEEDERLVPGTYFVDEVDGTATARIFVTIGAGWSNLANVTAIAKWVPPNGRPGDHVGSIAFGRPDRVFSDACNWSDGFYPWPVTNLNHLVFALSEQKGWVDVTAPSDISIDGYPGKMFRRTTPAPAVLSDCDTMTYGARSWPEPGVGVWPAFRSWESASDFGGFVFEPGETETLMVLDIDGTVVLINARLFPGPSAADRADFAAVLDSIRIDRG